MRVIIGLLILMVSCKQQGETTPQSQPPESANGQTIIEKRYDTLSREEFANLFKYEELKIYNLDSYKRFSDWSKKQLSVNGTFKVLELQGQPISYKSINEKITRITTLGEADNQLQIFVWTLDDDAQIIDYATLTSMGGDEGVGLLSFGKFLNDTLFSVTVQQTKYDSEEIEKENTHCLIFQANGKIETIENCHYR